MTKVSWREQIPGWEDENFFPVSRRQAFAQNVRAAIYTELPDCRHHVLLQLKKGGSWQTMFNYGRSYDSVQKEADELAHLLNSGLSWPQLLPFFSLNKIPQAKRQAIRQLITLRDQASKAGVSTLARP